MARGQAAEAIKQQLRSSSEEAIGKTLRIIMCIFATTAERAREQSDCEVWRALHTAVAAVAAGAARSGPATSARRSATARTARLQLAAGLEHASTSFDKD
eukprot:3010078-Pleurochrysis_carterae.AAC.4